MLSYTTILYVVVSEYRQFTFAFCAFVVGCWCVFAVAVGYSRARVAAARCFFRYPGIFVTIDVAEPSRTDEYSFIHSP
jgi:hypothetical protein